MSDALNQRDVDSLFRRKASGGNVTSDSLTQREIDAILQRNSPTPLAPLVRDDIQTYNFSRPPRVSRDRRAILDAIYMRFAISMQSLLSSLLRSPIDVVLNGVEQAMFSEFILSLGTPCAAFTFEISPRLDGEGAFDLSTDFAFHLVDRLFGGSGEATSPNRPLTPLEQTVVRSVTDRILSLLRDAWAEHLPVAPKLRSFESNPDMLQIASRQDNVLVTNFELRSTAFTGLLTMCMPMASLETFLQEKSNGRPARSGGADRESSRRQVEASLQHAHVGLAARFPTLWLSARVLAGLTAGQVLHTGQAADQPIELHVNDRLRFLGSLGQVRQHLGLRVAERVSKPAEDRPVQSRQGRVM